MTKDVRQTQTARIFQGSGTMADLVRSKEWAKSPLGPLENWPQILFDKVNFILSAPVPMMVYWGPDFISFYNDELMPSLAERHPAALGRPSHEIWPSAWPIIGEQLRRVRDSKRAEKYVRNPIPLLINGIVEHTFWDYSYMPLLSEDGTVPGVFCVGQDVTSAVRTEEGLKATQERLSQFLTATADAVIGVDRNWRFTFLNPMAMKLYSQGRNLVGKIMWDEFPNATYEGSPFVEHLERAMYDRIPGSFDAYYPAPLNMWIRQEVYPTPEGFVNFSRDITEQKRTEAALMQSEKLVAVGRLAASIAHEINNPLEAVTNLLYLARRTSEAGEIEAYLTSAEQELHRVSVITNQTLRFHKQSTNQCEISGDDLINTVLIVFKGRLLNAHVQIEKRFRAHRSVCCFDGEIRQVLNNLVSNGIDAMPVGGTLFLRTRDGRDWATGQPGIVLTIADTGSGMCPEVRGKIFEAFYSTKGIGGTGLGLWISKEIVQRHKGQLRVRSSQDIHHHGTVFTLFLPF